MTANVTARAPYLDNAATTPLDPAVWECMRACLEGGLFGNPASAHPYGLAAAQAVETARAQVAAAIGAAPGDIVWTSGATEANNLALLGLARANAKRGRHVISVRTEHKSVLEACARLEQEGFEVELLAVERDGRLPPERLAAALRPDTVLAAVMLVNNETGVVQDIPAIAEQVHAAGALLHVDAVQAAGRMAFDVNELGADTLSLSAHKVYGPKGVGCLFRRRRLRRRIQPLMWGGGHEDGLRPGTLATHQIAAMGAAFERARACWEEDARRAEGFRQRMLAAFADLGGVVLSGRVDGVPHILNVAFAGVHGEALTAALGELAVSQGSACSSASGAPSHVLRALGVPDQLAAASLRLSVGRFTTEPEVDAAVERIRAAVQRLRAFSPLWRAYRCGASLSELYQQPVTEVLGHE